MFRFGMCRNSRNVHRSQSLSHQNLMITKFHPPFFLNFSDGNTHNLIRQAVSHDQPFSTRYIREIKKIKFRVNTFAARYPERHNVINLGRPSIHPRVKGNTLTNRGIHGVWSNRSHVCISPPLSLGQRTSTSPRQPRTSSGRPCWSCFSVTCCRCVRITVRLGLYIPIHELIHIDQAKTYVKRLTFLNCTSPQVVLCS